jgi:methionyl-tRNA synthetase
MEKKEPFYVTTPIYYVNDVPHLGHAYTTVVADCLARFHRLRGEEVFFLTGTDEHGQKVQQAAEAAGIPPQDHCDRMVHRFQDLWEKLDTSHDDFIRTTQERHVKVVQSILTDLHERGEIYKDSYQGWYCVPDERFWTEKDIEEGKCPDCGRAVTEITEENYFFRMGKHQQWLIDYINNNPDFIHPVSRRNEILGFLRKELGDLCISRPKERLAWGVEIPFDTDFVTYVWFDALTNYITAPGYLADDERFTRTWSGAHHLIGKDILTTHAVYWPIMLHALGLPLPKTIFAHGWWTIEGKKMSKSVGNVIDPGELAEEYGIDVIRYFLMREVPFGLDGDFSKKALIGRINNDLANDLGNVFSRILAMTKKYFDGTVPPSSQGESALAAHAETAWEGVEKAVGAIAPHHALASIWEFIGRINKYLDDEKPWALVKDPKQRERLGLCLREGLESLRFTAILLQAFMPHTAARMWTDLGLEGEPSLRDGGPRWNGLPEGGRTSLSGPLFPRIEVKD